MKKSAVTAVSIILVSSFLFSGCQKDPELTREQKKWISQMEDWYPDDEFTYTVAISNEWVDKRGSMKEVAPPESEPWGSASVTLISAARE